MEEPSGTPATKRREALVRILGLGGLAGATAGLGVWLRSRSGRPEEHAALSMRPEVTVPPDPALPEMVIAQGDDPRRLVRAAVEALGGIRRFISLGDVVVIKPNIGWNRTPEQAANTNPDVVAETVRLCFEAGARSVIVTDASVNEPRQCFERSGIGPAARAEGAEVVLPDERKFRDVDLRGEAIGSWPILEPLLNADKIINIPVAKQHSLTGATLGVKNWYGILGGQRHRLHQRIHECLADLAGFMRPTLTILDSFRVLVRNGPTGGSPADVELKKTLIAGTDPIALDARAAKTFWDLDHRTLLYLKLASDRSLGNMDFERVRTRTLTL